jgi:sorting nexin-1/2
MLTRQSEPSVSSAVPTAVAAEPQTPSSPVNGTSRRIRTHPVFNVSVGDPTRIGDPVRGYTVYTVRTRTTSPHYRKGEFSVLRRFSDFLWLFEALTTNNPGIIVPPVPDKHPFGRFQDQFIETRRLALQRCLGKITSHPVLQLDPDLRMFLESDNFAMESKNRRPETPDKQGQGLLAGWTGPKYTEQDDWFDSRKVFLDSLESQLKALSKSIEGASKARLEMAISMGDFADGITALAESDLGSAMCAALARLADLSRREKETNEDQAKDEVVQLLNMADEYVRFIGSVRLAFASRIKAYHSWQALEKEVVRLRQTREKLRQQGKLGDRVQSSLAEIVDVSKLTRRFGVGFSPLLSP